MVFDATQRMLDLLRWAAWICACDECRCRVAIRVAAASMQTAIYVCARAKLEACDARGQRNTCLNLCPSSRVARKQALRQRSLNGTPVLPCKSILHLM